MFFKVLLGTKSADRGFLGASAGRHLLSHQRQPRDVAASDRGPRRPEAADRSLGAATVAYLLLNLPYNEVIYLDHVFARLT